MLGCCNFFHRSREVSAFSLMSRKPDHISRIVNYKYCPSGTIYRANMSKTSNMIEKMVAMFMHERQFRDVIKVLGFSGCLLDSIDSVSAEARTIAGSAKRVGMHAFDLAKAVQQAVGAACCLVACGRVPNRLAIRVRAIQWIQSMIHVNLLGHRRICGRPNATMLMSPRVL